MNILSHLSDESGRTHFSNEIRTGGIYATPVPYETLLSKLLRYVDTRHVLRTWYTLELCHKVLVFHIGYPTRLSIPKTSGMIEGGAWAQPHHRPPLGS